MVEEKHKFTYQDEDKYRLKVMHQGLEVNSAYEGSQAAQSAFDVAYRRKVDEATLFNSQGRPVLYFRGKGNGA